MGSHDRQRGFTVTEMLVAVAVLTILVAIAGPSYRAIVRGAQLTTQIYEFNATLALARSEAVKRGVPATVCPSTDQAACGASGTPWESGWIAFVDKNGNHAVDTGEDLLRANTPLATGYTLRGSAATTLDNYVTINPKGQISATGEFVLCQNDQIKPARAILVSNVGRIAIAAENDGVPVDADGADMTTCTP